MAPADGDTIREDDGPGDAARFLARPLLLAVIVFVLVVAFTFFLRGGDSDTILPAEVEPSGAGTEPRGIVEQDTGSTTQPLEASEGPTPAQD
jgi:hypothetical protein